MELLGDWTSILVSALGTTRPVVTLSDCPLFADQSKHQYIVALAALPVLWLSYSKAPLKLFILQAYKGQAAKLTYRHSVSLCRSEQ
jgi:hypothetical protein